MDASIIIPVHRDLDGLEITLRSIKEQPWYTSRVEVIVCNDGGGNTVSDLTASFGVIEARLDRNRGSYAARNAGIMVARAPALAFIDADEVVSRDWLPSGLKALEEADYVGGCVVIAKSGSSTYWQRVDASFAFPVRRYLDKWQFAPTANLFVHRRIFEDLGGFDEALISGGDREFGIRVAKNRFIQGYCSAATVLHPPRGLPEQLRKARRTSQGNARLEICLWRKPASIRIAKGIVFGTAKLSQALMLVVASLFIRVSPRSNEATILAAGHSLIGAFYNFSLATSAMVAIFHKRNIEHRIPRIGKLPR